MATKPTPPKWQKGRHEFEVTLPAHRTKSGKNETVKLAFRWEARTTKPMTARGWTKWEMECARRSLQGPARALEARKGLTNYDTRDLDMALTHAVIAWCRTHLRGKGTSHGDNHFAFAGKAPDNLRRLVSTAGAALCGLECGATTPRDAVAAVATAVDALLETASHPPRRRRRFPNAYRSG